MKPKTMVLMVVAVGCGLVASYMTSKLIAERGKEQVEAEPRIKVLVAKKKLQSMTPLSKPEDLFIEKEVPPDIVPKKAIKSFDELRAKNARLNKVINEENFVTTDDLVSKEMDGLAATLPKGMRAVAMRVTPESLAGGFIIPTSHVDVVATTRDGEPTSQVILQDMLVLAVDMNSTKSTEGGATMLGNTVTLAVWPEEATRLALAQSSGELRLLLRPLDDKEKPRLKPSKRNDFGKPIQYGTPELDAAAETALAANPGTPRIPDLPPVEATPAPMVPEEPIEEEKPLKKHVLTIRTGESEFKSTFFQQADGSWGTGASKSDPDEPGREVKKPKVAPRTPSAPPPAAPAKKDQPASPRPETLKDKLLNSGLPPVKQPQ